MNKNYLGNNLTLAQMQQIRALRNSNASEDEIQQKLFQNQREQQIDNYVKGYYNTIGTPKTTTQSLFSNSVEAIDNSDTQEQLPSEKSNFWETFGDTTKDIFGTLLYGATKGVEGVMDSVLGGISYIGNVYLGKDTSNIEDLVEKDIVGSVKAFGSNKDQTFREWLDSKTTSSLLNIGKAGEIAESVLSGVGGMLPSIGASFISPALGMPTMIASAIGGGTEEALSEGADINHAFGYGVTVGAIEGATEKLVGGFGSIAKTGILDKAFSKVTAKPLGKFLVGIAGEGVEEVLSDVANPFARLAAGLDKQLDMPTIEELGETFLVGSLCAGVIGTMQGGIQRVQTRKINNTQINLTINGEVKTFTFEELQSKLGDKYKGLESDLVKGNVELSNEDLKELGFDVESIEKAKEEILALKQEVDTKQNEVVDKMADKTIVKEEATSYKESVQQLENAIVKFNDIQETQTSNLTSTEEISTQPINQENVENAVETNIEPNNVEINEENIRYINDKKSKTKMPKGYVEGQTSIFDSGVIDTEIKVPTTKDAPNMSKEQINAYVDNVVNNLRTYFSGDKTSRDWKSFFKEYSFITNNVDSKVVKKIRKHFPSLFNLLNDYGNDFEAFEREVGNLSVDDIDNGKPLPKDFSQKKYDALLELEQVTYLQNYDKNILFNRSKRGLTQKQNDLLDRLFGDYINQEELQKVRDLEYTQTIQGTNANGYVRDRSVGNYYSFFDTRKLGTIKMTPAQLSRVAELVIRTQGIDNKYDIDLLNKFYRNADLCDPFYSDKFKNGVGLKYKSDILPTFMQIAYDTAYKQTGIKITFLNESLGRTGGYFAPLTKDLVISTHSSLRIENVVNHELAHSFVDKKVDNLIEYLELMKRLNDISAKVGGNTSKALLSHLAKQRSYGSYRKLPTYPFGLQSIESAIEYAKRVKEGSAIKAGDAYCKIEEGFAEIMGNDFTIFENVPSQLILDEINAFKEKHKKNFVDFDTSKLVYEGGDDTLFSVETLNGSVKRVGVDDIDTTNKNKPYNEIKTLTNSSVKEVVSEVQTKTKKGFRSFVNTFINSFSGVEAFFKKATNKAQDYAYKTSYIRAFSNRLDNYLSKGIMVGNQRMSKSFDEVFGWFDKHFPRFGETAQKNYDLKQSFYDYALHYHNIDRMNIIRVDGMNVDFLKSIIELSDVEIESIDKFVEEKTALIGDEVTSLSFEELEPLIEEHNLELAKSMFREYKSIFGKYLKLDALSTIQKDTIKAIDEKQGSRLLEDLENRGWLDEGYIQETYGTRVRNMVKDMLLEISSEDSKKKIKWYEENFKEYEFDKHIKDLWKFADATLQLSLEGGLISEKQYNAMKKIYPHYIPTDREYIGKIKTSYLNDAKGSNRLIDPIDITMFKNLKLVTKRATVNMLSNDIYSAFENSSVDLSKYVSEAVEVRRTSLDTDISNIDLDLVTDSEAKHVRFKRNGKLMEMEVCKDIAEAYNALNVFDNVGQTSDFLKWSSKLMKFFRSSVTDWNPFFIVRNFTRDLQDALLYTQSPKRFFQKLPTSYKEIVSGGKYWEMYCAYGGLSSTILDTTYGTINNLDPITMTEAQYKRMKTKNKAKKFFEKMHNANMVIEQAPRLTEFILTVEAYMKENGIKDLELVPREVYMGALNNAMDITVNFNRSGKVTKFLNSHFVPFLNAQVQGFDKLARTLRGSMGIRPMAMLIAKCSLLGVIPAVLNALIYSDDDDYDRLSDYTKDNYWLIKVGNKFFQLPRGRILGLVQSATTRFIEQLRGDEEAFDGYFESAWSNVSPVNDFRSIVSPITDVMYNKNWYGGTIVASKYDNIRPNKQYNNDTSLLAKKIALLNENWSPLKIDYLLDSYSGIFGDILLPTTANDFKSPLSFVEKQFIVDSETSTRYYGDFDKVLKEYQYQKTDGDLYATLSVKYLTKVKNSINDLYKQQQEVEEDSVEYRTLQVLINNMYKTALDNYKVLESEISKYPLTEENLDDVYQEALFNTFGGEIALKFTNTTKYQKAQALQSSGITYDMFYYINNMTRGNLMDSNSAFRFINKMKLNYNQKLLVYTLLGYPLNNQLKKKVEIIYRRTKDELLKEQLKKYLE